jgi:urease accessory protein UreH
MVLLTPAGALFDGDDVSLRVLCGSGTDVTITTAAATKLNRCDNTGIAFTLQADVAAHATLRYLPHELIPFRGCRYRQQVIVDLAADAACTLLEVIGPGRSDDRFAYHSLVFDTTIRVASRTAVHEHYSVHPAALGGATHYASLLRAPARDVTAVRAALAQHTGGASLGPHDSLVAKAIGLAALPLREALLAADETPGWLRTRLPP